ncbi:TonB-dependent receptor [Steroidobacter sp.]|uniref:TonB-dependent receptor n=1 Tax=Steroidobacter sp. TaxID=1978227 RepID=UPI001A4E838A|nr:TonB-dependent receptor [Steroidobacter sp.]MBL8266421.1 TonB-dependent receptor [Steroidobacter sp.]
MSRYVGLVMASVVTTLGFGSHTVSAQSKDEAESFNGLETVVVTSQKRSEDSQKVALTVTALDASALESRQIETVSDLAQAVPGFQIQKISGAAYPFLRGLGLQSSGPWQEAPVSTYIDGVYYVNPTINQSILNNLERIEVIKGPQGTLFGRNATGGVVSYVTKDPTHEPRLDVALGYGNYDTWSGSLYGTTGITENLAADIALVGEDQREGWGKDLYTGKDVHTSYKYSVRSKWVWTPNDRTKLTWISDYGRAVSAESGNGSVRGVYDFVQVGPRHVGGFYDTYLPNEPTNLSTQYGTSVNLQLDWDWTTFTSISALRRAPEELDGPDPFDVPFLVNTPQVGQIDGLRTSNLGYKFNKTFTQEFQITSPESSTIRWVGGVFLLFDNSGYYEKNDYRLTSAGLRNRRSRTKQETESYSAFAEATAPVFEDTRLTLGVRYTRDHRSVEGYGSQNTIANPNVYVITPGTTGADNPVPSDTWSKPTYKVSVEHDVAEDTLAYFTFSTGFQSAFYSITNDANRPPLEPVTLKAYEIGMKSDFFGHTLRLNASAFLYDLSNVIVSAFANGSQNQRNAAESRIKGIDMDLTYRPIRDLTFSAGFQILDPKYTEYRNALVYVPVPAQNIYTITSGDVSGEQLQWSEKFMGTASVNYVIPMSAGEFSLNAAYTYHSGTHYDTQDLNTQDPYSLINASIGWAPFHDKWDVRLWGKNLADKQYVSAFQSGTTVMKYTPAEPRTYGVRFAYYWK